MEEWMNGLALSTVAVRHEVFAVVGVVVHEDDAERDVGTVHKHTLDDPVVNVDGQGRCVEIDEERAVAPNRICGNMETLSGYRVRAGAGLA